MSNLNVPAIENSHSNLQNNDPTLTTVNSYDKLPCIDRIKIRSCYLTFSFRKTNSNEVSKIADDLTIKKARQNSVIPTKIIKVNKDINVPFIFGNFNSCIDKGKVPNDLKPADIVPVHKKKSKSNKLVYFQTFPSYMKN